MRNMVTLALRCCAPVLSVTRHCIANKPAATANVLGAAHVGCASGRLLQLRVPRTPSVQTASQKVNASSLDPG
jgi:hypothetical protein